RSFSAGGREACSCIHARSAPALKLGPLPDRTTTRTAASWPAAAKASVSSCTTTPLNALRTSGRLSRTCSTAPARATSIVEYAGYVIGRALDRKGDRDANSAPQREDSPPTSRGERQAGRLRSHDSPSSTATFAEVASRGTGRGRHAWMPATSADIQEERRPAGGRARFLGKRLAVSRTNCGKTRTRREFSRARPPQRCGATRMTTPSTSWPGATSTSVNPNTTPG